MKLYNISLQSLINNSLFLGESVKNTRQDRTISLDPIHLNLFCLIYYKTITVKAKKIISVLTL